VHREVRLRSTSTAPNEGRLALDGWLNARVGERIAEDARLAVSELLANAVRHGGLGEHEEILLTVNVSTSGLSAAGVLGVAVEQPSSAAGAAMLGADDRGASGGFGLVIVDELADRWAVEAGPPGRVWFEMTVPGEPSTTGA
jgi:anti-sigma regulatory factor (Ser/Thr protein kinase)